jgi:CheY-like chemotaxis protein
VIRLISAVAGLVEVLIWPAVLVFFLVYFRRSLRNFISNLGELSFKAPGLEATAKRAKEEAAAAIGAAEAVRAPSDGARTSVHPRDVADALPDTRALRRLQGSNVLWVDEVPDNNVFERQALEALGVRIDLSTSTNDALEKISRRSYDLIISDMGRPADMRAGYALLDKLRDAGERIPFVIYSSSRSPELVKEARRHGAIDSTNSPQGLVTIVTTSLADTARR